MTVTSGPPQPVPSLPRRVRAVFFDAGETLLAPEPSFARRFRSVVLEHGLRLDETVVADAVTEGLRRVSWPSDWRDQAGQKAFWTGFYREVLADLGYRGDDERLAAALFESFTDPAGYKLFADTLPVLDDLDRRGLTLGVVSNWEPWLADVLELEGVHDRFATVVVSGVLGVAKPDPAIFHAALREAGTTAEETVYVGDSPAADVQGAAGAGLAPVLLDRRDQHPDTEGVPRITSLSELPGLLDR